MRDGITLTMIAKDEEVGIPRALKSLEEAVDDMVVLVDSRTTDRTKEIADEMGARTLIYEWQDDFAASRNQALSLVETEWAICLDGHEYLEEGSAETIRKGIEEAPEHVGGFFISVQMESGQKHRSLRLHRVAGSAWKNPAHNILNVNGPVMDLTDAVIIHDRRGGQSPESILERNEQRDQHLVRTLQKRILDSDRDTRSMFYLAQQHRDAGRWEAAYYWYARYTRVEKGNQWPEENYQAAYQAGRAALMLKDTQEGAMRGLLATQQMPHRGEGWALLADAYYQMSKWQEAMQAYKRANQCDPPKDALLPVDLKLHRNGILLLDQLSMCCWRLGLYEEGAELCRKLLAREDLPTGQRKRVEDNLGWHERRLAELEAKEKEVKEPEVKEPEVKEPEVKEPEE